MQSDGLEWMEEGVCRGADGNVFFATDGHGVRVAQAICATCPVINPCLEYALDNRINEGVWGGQSERARRRILRARRSNCSTS